MQAFSVAKGYIQVCFLCAKKIQQLSSAQTGWVMGESAKVVVVELDVFLANAWWTMPMSTTPLCTEINCWYTIPIPLRFSSRPCRVRPKSFLSHSWINSVLYSSVFILMDMLAERWYGECVWLEIHKVGEARSTRCWCSRERLDVPTFVAMPMPPLRGNSWSERERFSLVVWTPSAAARILLRELRAPRRELEYTIV